MTRLYQRYNSIPSPLALEILPYSPSPRNVPGATKHAIGTAEPASRTTFARLPVHWTAVTSIASRQ